MKLTNLLTNRVSVLRLDGEEGSDKLSFVTSDSCMASIQPQSDFKSQIADGVFGKRYVLYSDGNVPLYQGDKLKDEIGNYYVVKMGGVTYRQHGRIGYQKIIVELLDS